MTIKIVHMSHDHRLMVIRSGLDASFECGACGTTHRPGISWAQSIPLVYVCSACCFWLHPHCAMLPNAIFLNNSHPHPLLLNYRWTLIFNLKNISQATCLCAICRIKIESRGVYSCTMCDFYVHIMCAITDNRIFQSVLIRDAQFPDLIHFPIPDEYTSVVRYITSGYNNNTSAISNTSGVEVLVHQHPLTLNHHDLDGDENEDEDEDEYDRRRPSCNACVQLISPPFYTCSECPNLFLHDCCARLPQKLKRDRELTLFFDRAATKFDVTSCCDRHTNGFTYCRFFTTADVSCAIMPTTITHDAHSKTHMLYSSFANEFMSQKDTCHCCGLKLTTFFYYCGTCQSFKIHAKCAQLPRTVRHVFDKHPLKLVTTPLSHQSLFCDACEEELDDRWWYYRCHQCDQSFHVDCIPCLDEKSLIQFGKPQVRVQCHKCPLALAYGEMARGRRCAYCCRVFKGDDSDSLVLECFKCYFWIHRTCSSKFVGIN